MNYYGIDLGTSNTLVAQLSSSRGKTEIELLETELGNTLIPSVVHFSEDGKAVVGSHARQYLSTHPDQTFELVKIRIGVEDYLTYYLNGKEHKISPQHVIGYLLKYIRTLPTLEPIKQAVVTVPAEFDDNRRGATQQAAVISNIELIELLAEPSAAILYHIYSVYNKSGKVEDVVGKGAKNYFVFDFGGGTLDLSLVRLEMKDDGTVQPTVIENMGNSHLGGNDIDFAFMNEALAVLKEDYSRHPFFKEVIREFEHFQKKRFLRFEANSAVKQFLVDLKGEVERAKIQLSTVDEAGIVFSHPDFETLEVSCEEFESEVVEKYFRHRVKESLDNFRLKLEDSVKVDEVVMVGGSSKIPYFKEYLTSYFKSFNLGDRVIVSEDYDTAVARGAAIQTALRSGMAVSPFGINRCNNAVAHDIYIKHMGEQKMLIQHGTPYPIPAEEARSEKFRIGHSLQTHIPILIKEVCTLYQQETNDTVRQENVIRDMKFYHPFFYYGDTVTVKARLDEHGILHFMAIHDATGEAIEFEAEQACQLSAAELESAKREVSLARVSGL